MAARFYTAKDGTKYPLTEAKYDMDFTIYKSHKRKAIVGDVNHCLLAEGVRKHKDVLDVHIGSAGDAFVIFKASSDESAHAVHFKVKAATRRDVVAFDKDKKAVTKRVTLSKPPISWTLDHRDASNKRRRQEIKDGSPIKRRGKPRATHVSKYGVHHRPRAPISKSGNVNLSVD